MKRYLIEVTSRTDALCGGRVCLGYSMAGDRAWVGLVDAARIVASGVARFVDPNSETDEALLEQKAARISAPWSPREAA